MRVQVDVVLILPMLISLPWTAVRGEDPAAARPIAEQLPGLHLLQGPWDGGTIHRESVLFTKQGEAIPRAKLLYNAERILEVRSADDKCMYTEGQDFVLTPDRGSLLLTIDSPIVLLNEQDLFPPKGSSGSIPHRAGQPETNLFFDNGHGFHDRQVEVTYVPRNAKWAAYRPQFAGERLGRVIGKLKRKEPVTIAVSGDSISEGFNASAFSKTTPFMPPYPALVAAQLQATYGANVTLCNLAVGGWSSSQGVDDLKRLLDTKPDLVIIAYGMNDVGARNPKAYQENIAAMLKGIHDADPATEVILVATMTGNPEWAATPPEMFPVYRDVLASLEKPGVVLADLTAVWQRLLRRKQFLDITGNGVNHPDDYGHRVYAQAILALLVDPSLVPKVESR